MKFIYLLYVNFLMKWYDLFDIPKASLILITNDKGEILSVSRKDNFDDQNIIGGKVDKGETFEEAAIRECKEETNLDIYDLQPIFFRKDGKFKCITFIAKYKGEIGKYSEKETGKIEWIKYDTLFNGSFGEYNRELKNKIVKYNICHLS